MDANSKTLTRDAGEKRRALVRSLLIFGGIAAVIGLLAYGFTTDPREIRSPLVGSQASDFELRLLDGPVVRLSDYRGRVVFLNFWASWCPPCRAEARLLEEAWRQVKDRGIVFLGVNIQDTDEGAHGFIGEFGITYPNGRDPQSRIAIDYGVYGIPETFFIDKEGRITYKHTGALGAEILGRKLVEASRGIVTVEGRGGGYQSVR
ncbi:MAG: TlpA family protein disulfide reductase [candidate division NC10 bacterium]|nr:TlpA family protein disulfide reductase [candidate division NC10 bacterium]